MALEAWRRVHFLKPELVAEIKFAEWMHDGRARLPVFAGLRFDKPPRECVFEHPLPSKAAARKPERGRAA